MNEDLKKRVLEANEFIRRIRQETAKKVVGQNHLMDSLLMALIVQGHVLVEGVPGLAKTLAVSTLSEVINVDFQRIQFTPDLLPADLTGTMIYRPQTGEFVVRKGPVFSNIILADEINRAPAKVQSALLEAMAERQVTLGDKSHILPDPFFVLATQNPIEQEGTYQLPEAQLDRFLVKILVDYPQPDEELEIIRRHDSKDTQQVRKLLHAQNLNVLRQTAKDINVDERIQKYIVSLVTATRLRDKRKQPFVRFIDFGASPRASIALLQCCRVEALLQGRAYVLPEDVKDVAHRVLRHRIVLSYEAEAEGLFADDIIDMILSHVVVP
ncbi:MAG: AAA family ATPase [Spirochaetaceae bacterium]|nr:AAA family ATPase [Spirochaetaceae bacterium]